MDTQHEQVPSVQEEAKKAFRPLRPRVLWSIVRSAGLVESTMGFVILFVICPLVVRLSEPSVTSFGDATWYIFTIVSTIGLGDFTCVTIPGRIATFVFSVYSIFYIALITGAVVSVSSERLRMQRDESVADLIDRLEHLPELSKEELTELSDKIKRYRR